MERRSSQIYCLDRVHNEDGRSDMYGIGVFLL